MIRFRISILVLVLSTLFAAPLVGAACCVSASSFGIGRLYMWEQLALSLHSNFSNDIGFYDTDFSYENYNQAFSNSQLMHTLAMIWRYSQRAQAFLNVPIVFYFHDAESAAAFYGNPGDVQVGLRYQLIEIGEWVELPGIALHFAFSIPSGAAQTEDPWRQNSSLGAFGGSGGLILEKNWTSWFFQLQANALFLQSLFDDMPQRISNPLSGQVAFSVGRQFNPYWVLAAQIKWNWNSNKKLNELWLEESSGYKTGLSVSSSYQFASHWHLINAFSFDMPFAYLGRNSVGSYNVTVGIRYGFW